MMNIQETFARGPRTSAIAAFTGSDSIHTRLRSATAEHHRVLDHGLRYVLGKELSIERYGNLLAAFYGFYVALEVCLARLLTATPPIAVPLVPRAALLEQDLRALGLTPVEVPICIEMPRLDTVDHLAGALYVVEGACLGGQVIARAVMQRFGFGRDNGAAFFIGDGAQTAARWKRVLAWLEERERGAAAGHEIIEGACRAFESLFRWLSRQGVLDE